MLNTMIVHKIWIINLVLSVVIAVTCVVGDIKLRTVSKQLTKSIWDNAAHALIGFFSSTIILTNHVDYLYLAVACMMMSSIIDVDHFIAARSVKLSVRTFISRQCQKISRETFILGCSELIIATIPS